MVVLDGIYQSATQDVLHYRFGIAVDSKHLSEVLDLLPLLSFFTHLLSSHPQTQHNSSEHLGRVMGVEVQVSVCVCVIVEDRTQCHCFLPLYLDVQEDNLAFQLPFHCELVGGIMSIQVLVEPL